MHSDIDEQIWVYRGPTPTIPVEWSVITGEILYNMRSALDHLVWQLVLNNEQTPGRHNEFPITNDQERWLQEKARMLKGVSQRHQAMVGYLQPFTGGVGLPFGVSNLRVIDQLSNIEKHRHLVVAVIASRGIEPRSLDFDGPEMADPDSRPPYKGTAYVAQIESGKVLAKFNNADRLLSPSFRVDLQLAGEVQLWTAGTSWPDLLTKCLETVKGSAAFLTTSMGNGFVEATSKR